MNTLMNTRQMSQNNVLPTYIVVQTSSPASMILMFTISLFGLAMTYLTYRQSKNRGTQTATLPAKLIRVEHKDLHDILDQFFDEQELRHICFEMGLDYEDLPFSGQTNKARELVALSVRCGQFAQLQAIVKAARPHLIDMVVLTQNSQSKQNGLTKIRNGFVHHTAQINA